MKKTIVTSLLILTLSFGAKAQNGLTFVPQLGIGYSLLTQLKTNSVGLSLGGKVGYVFNQHQRICLSAEYAYFFGKKNKTTGYKNPAMGHIPVNLHYAFPIINKSENNTWYLEPTVGYSIWSDNTKNNLKGFNAGVGFITFDNDEDPGELGLYLNVAKINGVNGLLGSISFKFGFMSMFSRQSTNEGEWRVKSIRVIED